MTKYCTSCQYVSYIISLHIKYFFCSFSSSSFLHFSHILLHHFHMITAFVCSVNALLLVLFYRLCVCLAGQQLSPCEIITLNLELELLYPSLFFNSLHHSFLLPLPNPSLPLAFSSYRLYSWQVCRHHFWQSSWWGSCTGRWSVQRSDPLLLTWTYSWRQTPGSAGLAGWKRTGGSPGNPTTVGIKGQRMVKYQTAHFAIMLLEMAMLAWTLKKWSLDCLKIFQMVF